MLSRRRLLKTSIIVLPAATMEQGQSLAVRSRASALRGRIRLGKPVRRLLQVQASDKPKVAEIAGDQGVVPFQSYRGDQRIRDPQAMGEAVVMEEGHRTLRRGG